MMAILYSTRLYIILPWVYFTLLDTTLLYLGSTSMYWILHYPTMALPHSSRHYITLPWLYYTLYYTTMAPLPLTILCHGSSYLRHTTLSTSTLLHSTSIYHGVTWLYYTQHQSTMVLLDSTMVLLDFTTLFLTTRVQIALYFTLLVSTLLYHGSTSLF